MTLFSPLLSGVSQDLVGFAQSLPQGRLAFLRADIGPKNFRRGWVVGSVAGSILLCMGLFSRFCVWALRCTADEYLHCVRDTSYRLIDSTPTHPALARAEPDARAQKLLRVDGIAVDARFVMQMRAGGATGGADGADHLS